MRTVWEAHVRALLSGIALCGFLSAASAQGCLHIPSLGAGIDEQLPQAKLTDVDRKKVEDLRKQIGALAAAGKDEDARTVEEEAMRLLGYSKALLLCGPGTFTWAKVQFKP